MYRLIYKSRTTSEIDWDTISTILNDCEKSNQEHEIGGVLLATETHFLQVLEGKYEDINETFFRIAKDPRHTDLQLISFDVIDSRLFKSWGMRGLGVMDFNKSLAAMLKTKYGEDNGQLRFPAEQWLTLAMINDIKMVHGLPEWKKG